MIKLSDAMRVFACLDRSSDTLLDEQAKDLLLRGANRIDEMENPIDLTALDRPLGEYPDAVVGAILRAKAEGRVQCHDPTDGGWDATNSDYYDMRSTYRLAPEPRRPMSPPWDVLPEWVQAVARDENKTPYAYEVVPDTPGAEVWTSTTGRMLNLTEWRFDRGNMPWRESLVLRPEGE